MSVSSSAGGVVIVGKDGNSRAMPLDSNARRSEALTFVKSPEKLDIVLVNVVEASATRILGAGL